MSKTVFENEQLITVPTGDYITLDIAGNKTDGNDVFRQDLGKGEEIIKEFIVNLRPPVIRNVYVFYLTCILTFGLYYVYIYYCGCCRQKLINTRRARLVLTSHGRLGVWHTVVDGIQDKGPKGYKTVFAKTKISWFNIKDISHMQHYHYVKKLTECFCFSTNLWSSSLRIFFGCYPDQATSDGLNATLAVPKSIFMSDKLIPTEISSYFSVSGYFAAAAAGAANVATALFSTLGQIFIVDDSNFLEIESSVLDTQNDDPEAVYQELLSIQKAMMEIKDQPPALNAEPTSNFKMVNERTKLVDDGIAYIQKSSLALCNGEEILDAYTYEVQWTLMEILLSIATFGIYWFLYVRERHALKSAVIISNFRVFEISQDMQPVTCASGENFTYIVRSWFLDGLDSGIVASEKMRMWTQFQTRFGALKIEPFIPLGWLESFMTGIPLATRVKCKTFLFKFANGYQFPQLLASNNAQSVTVPAMVSENLKLSDNEHIVAYTDSKNKFIGTTMCGESKPALMVLSYLSCGKFPMDIWQEMSITSHRVLASASAVNAPLCCTSCLSPTYEFYFWSALGSKYLLGPRLEGDVSVKEDFWTRNCGCCGITPTDAVSRLSLNYAFGADKKGKPVTLFQYKTNAEKGLLDDERLNEIRYALGNALMNNAGRGHLNYFATSNPNAERPVAIEMPPPYAEKKGTAAL